MTLAGLAVNQNGRVSATSSVQLNGSVRLQARDGGSVQGGAVIAATRGGVLTLGEGSRTEVSLDSKPDEAAVDVTKRFPSEVLLSGDQIRLLARSSIVAPSGAVNIIAQANPGANVATEGPSDSRVYFAPGAVVDVSGAEIEKSMESNVIEVELRANEMRDSPLQRDGELRGQRVSIDVRRSGVRSDGTSWQGTPLADVSGNISAIQRTAAERNLMGGTVNIASQGDVILSGASLIDVAGGHIRYRDGFINTTQLLSNGSVLDIAAADRDGQYQGVVGSVYTVEHPRWGVKETFTGFGAVGVGRFEAGYIEGKDAGSIQISGRRMVLDGDLRGEVAVGRHQRSPAAAFDAASRLYRPYDQTPLRGRLQIGGVPSVAGVPDYRTSDVRFDSRPLLPTLRNEVGEIFDPLLDRLPDDFTEVHIDPTLLGDRLGGIQIFSNGRITIPEDAALRGHEGATLQLTAGQIDFAGSFASHGGDATLAVEPTVVTEAADVALELASGASIDVRGRWVNDEPELGGPAVAGPDT